MEKIKPAKHRKNAGGICSDEQLKRTVEWAAMSSPQEVITALATATEGLSQEEAARRLILCSTNEAVIERRKNWFWHLLGNLKDPLFLLLLSLGIISLSTGDTKGAAIISIMLFLSVSLRFIQERRADAAAEKLKSLIRTTATVIRGGKKLEIPLKNIVPGDVVELSAGDMVPADLRLINSKDLYINQAALTGESLPVEKHAPAITKLPDNAFELQNICFMGNNVSSGIATGVIVATGARTRFGQLAGNLVGRHVVTTSFDKGVQRYTWLMLRFIFVMVPLVFFINGLSKGDWLEAFLFAVAVAVGLTPEMLPMIVTVNLSKAALVMSAKKVIVKRLNAIQDFGAMDVLCTDKTGTLTQGKVVLIKHVDIKGEDSARVLEYAYLNSFFQTGLQNMLDEAVLNHDAKVKSVAKKYEKIDEIPFDFKRRRMSVAVQDCEGKHVLICKGAVEEVLAACTKVQVGNRAMALDKTHHDSKDDLVQKLSSEGFRLIALASKSVPTAKSTYSVVDESGLTLLGFLAFLDPPKVSAANAIKELQNHGVKVKILTGDNELVTRKICKEVKLEITGYLKGNEIENMDDAALQKAVEIANVFDKLEPAHKSRVIQALQKNGHVVGFMGDGINDAPALEAADVGISVEGAVDVAKESSDIILLEKSLMILKEGVLEGRRAFGNITKYIKMTASSNFGNMFSVVGGSIFLPFLPMLPLQIIINNLMYDFSQVSIPTDSVDEDYLLKPRQWRISNLARFVLFIGPLSSIFDYGTYFVMLYVFNCWGNPTLFHTGWFVESLITQTLIVHIIRTKKIPFLQSSASLPLTLTTLAIVAFGIWLPFSPLASTFGFAPLPALFWLILAGFLLTYFLITQFVKNWFVQRYGWD